MFIINSNKCIGCGLCVKDCFQKEIEIIENKAYIKNESCIKCGHCIAVCPENAVFTDEYNMMDVNEYSKNNFDISEDNLLNFIKFRRSTRQFKDKDVSEQMIMKIIEAGRFTQTGSNLQEVSYIVVKDDLHKLKKLALKSLKSMGEYILGDENIKDALIKRYANLWIKMYDQYEEDPKKNDRLFFNAPVVIIVTANSDVNGALASSNMELMTNAMGLGTFFSGFLVRAAANGNKEVSDFLGVKEGHKIATCMVIGYPDVKYLRTAPRKKADIIWK
jgi:nitroreductase/NAD-dependent dihydropyrimidine dehydrogenase PreA subunit